ncbi:MAG: lipoyl(octanoyl) transferase LipB [Acidobacteria bacterium]|nr:lipoyl(octanoyl) transferase LipB [Acidobacteriota bacterium]
MPDFQVRDLGRMSFGEAFGLQQNLVSQRKAGEICNQLLLVEHPHVITMGRNGHLENMLAGEDLLSRAGIAFHHTDRGGDVTYHGPGQIVAYPIFDLKDWKRDVGAYVRSLEEVVIRTLADYGFSGERITGCTGVWVNGAKVCAIGVHLSRWVTSHGLALNVTTDLDYFRYIIPCGLTRPVTSMQVLGSSAGLDEVKVKLVDHFSRVFDSAALLDQDSQLLVETIA